jgi:hypothetical protein
MANTTSKSVPIICEAKRRMKMLELNQSRNLTYQIANALYNKSKRTFRHRKRELIKQANVFSSKYQDFIYKVINSNSLRIKHYYKMGYIVAPHDEVPLPKLTKKYDNLIVTDINNVTTLPHELGHAVDFWFGQVNSLTSSVLLNDNKTFAQIFKEEFDSSYEDLYQMIMNEYKQIINSNISDRAYDIFINNIDKYRELSSIKIDKNNVYASKRRKQLQDELTQCGFVNVYYLMCLKKCSDIINNKYSPILDALSSKYNLDELLLAHHDYTYYDNDSLIAQELFANLFQDKVTSNFTNRDIVRKYLPRTYRAFEQLFDIFYTHIQNNKRFTDVRLREVN